MVLQCNIPIDGKYSDKPAKLILGWAFTGGKKGLIWSDFKRFQVFVFHRKQGRT